MRPQGLRFALLLALLVMGSLIGSISARGSDKKCDKPVVKVSLVAGQAVAELAKYVYVKTNYGIAVTANNSPWRGDLPFLQGDIYAQYFKFSLAPLSDLTDQEET